MAAHAARMPSDTARSFAVAAPSRGTLLWWLWAPLLLLISIDPLIQLVAGRPPVNSTFDSWGPVVFVPLVALVLSLLYRRRSIRVDSEQLDITSTLYRKQVPLSAMLLDRARIVRFEEYPEFRPALKSNGYQLPGFRSGHFRMQDGSKGFCLITDDTRVLVLPLRDGSSVLVSPEKPRVLLDELRRLAERGKAA